MTHNPCRLALCAAVLGLLSLSAPLTAADGKTGARMVAVADFAAGLDGWEYYGGYEYPGSQGRLERESRAGPKGTPCAKLTADFTAGGSYVAMTKAIDAPCAGVTIQLKAVGCRTINLRLTDSTGQTFQQPVTIKATDDWQIVTVQDPVGNGNSWGGAKDRVWHQPATKISIMSCAPTTGPTSSVQIAHVALHTPKL
jgi:hypothetical protein